MLHNLSEQSSLLHHYLSEIRDVKVQEDRMRFRENLERIGEIMAYELSKTLTYEQTHVETPLGQAQVSLFTDRIVLATVLRAGLPMHQGMLHYFDKADNAFISAYRKHHKDGSFEIKQQYVSCPDLTDATLIVSDPMLATGASMTVALETLQDAGLPKQVHIVTAIASRQGIDHLRRLLPKAHIWVGAIDEELTAKAYIVPGLGDAGDLSFGEKMQD